MEAAVVVPLHAGYELGLRPLRVITGSLGQVTRTSAPRCKADEIGGKADIGPRTSAFGVRADSLAYPMECLLVAKSGHRHSSGIRPSSPPSSGVE